MPGRQDKIMLRYSPLSIVLEALSCIALMAMLALAVNMYPSVGETFPIGFGDGGEVLRYAPRSTAMFHPIITVIVYVIITGGCLAARKAAPPDTPCPRMEAVLNCICVCKSVYILHETAVTWCNMSFVPVFGWLLPAAATLGVVFIAAFAAQIIRLTKKKYKRKLEGAN